jgi:cysteinyl-tRNA synthetase
MFYGYEDDDQPTPAAETSHLLSLCILCEEHGVEVLATDYCSTHSNMDDSYLQNAQNGFISFAADQRELNNIPDYPSEPWNVNSSDVFEIPLAKNFLYLLNGENYSTKQEFISAVCSTDYDAVIMDLFYEGEQFTREELEQMRFKNNGGRRILICYMSIGEAEDYRYYWQPEWNTHKPSWLGEENPFWPGNYKVDYWNPEWQAIIFGNENSYLQKIIDTGFDGVYLDIIDAFEFFENTRGARQG